MARKKNVNIYQITALDLRLSKSNNSHGKENIIHLRHETDSKNNQPGNDGFNGNKSKFKQ